MKIKLTPLNIVLAALFTALIYFILFPHQNEWRILNTVSILMICVTFFISDILFRYFIKDIKRIWIVELVFIIFAAILMMLLKKI